MTKKPEKRATCNDRPGGIGRGIRAHTKGHDRPFLYHRYAKAPDLSPAARILAAAEAYCTAIEDRPHRPGLSVQAAAAKLRELVKAGRLCADGTEAVLTAAGQASRRAGTPGIDGLTPREIEVLRHIASGLPEITALAIR